MYIPTTNSSLVPRPSHHPVFDHLQNANQSRKDYLGKMGGGGGPNQKNELEAFSVPSASARVLQSENRMAPCPK